MTSLAEIRKKLASIETKKTNSSGTSSASFPFWDMDVGSTSRVRFLPDGNPENVFFWKIKETIKLPFPGVKGGDENKPVYVQVPCMNTWGEACPILTETKAWWDDPALKSTASTYWKKRVYYFQGFVTESSVKEASERENPIRTFAIGPQIFEIIKSSLMDPDFENVPTDYLNGTNFAITKTQSGKYADYGTSAWARKETPLSQDQLAAIEQHGLSDLSEFLPKKPTPEQLAAIFEMFEASVDGELYNPSRWAKYYKPYGLEYNDTSAAPASTVSNVTVHSNNTADTTDELPFEETVSTAVQAEVAAPKSSSAKSAMDILDMIKNRNKT